MSTPATIQKRQQLLDFIDQYLKPEPAVHAVVGIGSIAFGTMRPDSDIDAILFMDPLDYYIVPAESKWMPERNTYHSIFSKDPEVHEKSIQLDFQRFDLKQWSAPDFNWSAGQRAAFVESWLAYDRDGRVAQLFAERTAYTAADRMTHLDKALLDLDLQLKWDDPAELWESLGPAVALDRAQSAYEALIAGLFAYNWRWRPWREREMTYVLTLPWLPPNFAERVIPALNAPSTDLAGYCQRFATLSSLCDDLLNQLADEDDYGAEPIDQAFTRSHNQPGYAHNMDEWNAEHAKRQGNSS